MDQGIWSRSEAPDVRTRDRLVLAVIAGAGFATTIRLADWWFRGQNVSTPILFALLSISFWYAILRVALGWINHLGITKSSHRPAPSGLSVAIFTTSAPGEPLSMFGKTLAACERVRYPHKTYLLDDTGDPAFRELAERHRATWLEIVGAPGAKAGKINRALEMTSEEFILVLDPDHVPFPEFLDRVLGHFTDSSVGFVQVAQAYYNQPRSLTARGAAEQTYTFYGPGQMGLYGHGACVAIGANCTFRRAALEQIGGHGIGLAEDLITAVRLHAAGWKSIYVPEVVSRGLVPEDLGSFYRQQLKWSRGVYEVAFAELPHAFSKLSWRQRLAYFAIGTYYLSGVTTLLFLFFPYLYLWTGFEPTSMRFADFLLYAGPVGLIGMISYFYSQRWLTGGRLERGIHLRGLVLKLASWPIYLAGTVLALLNRDIPYIPTSKTQVRGRFFRLAWPQLLLIALYLITILHVAKVRIFSTSEGDLELTSEAIWGMVAFATLPVVSALAAIVAAWQSSRPVSDVNAWEPIHFGGEK